MNNESKHGVAMNKPLSGKKIYLIPLFIFSTILLLVFCEYTYAEGLEMIPPSKVPAAPMMTTVAQPNGAVINIYLKGDEWCNWIETDTGYTIAKGVDGFWYYATDGEETGPDIMKDMPKGVRLLNVQAHEPAPDGLPQHIRPSCSNKDKQKETI